MADRTLQAGRAVDDDLRDIILRYVYQLTQGCGSDICTERLCVTGLRNSTPERPVRKFTPRSARSIAIAIASGPSPRRHLCIHYAHQHPVEDADDAIRAQEGPRDPSSFMQSLSDTTAIRELCSPSLTRTLVVDNKLKRLHMSLDILTTVSPVRALDVSNHVLSNHEVSDIIHDCFRWLSAQHGEYSEADITVVDELVSNGHTCLTSGSPEGLSVRQTVSQCTILDSLHSEPNLRLLQRTLGAIASRVCLENAVEAMAVAAGKIPGARRGIITSIVQTLKNHSSDIVSCILYLKAAFLTHWDGKATVPPGSPTRGALELLAAWSEDLGGPPVAIPAVATRLDVVDVARSWLKVSAGSERDHLLSYQFLLGPLERAVYFRCINHLKMREAHSLAEKAAELRRYVALDSTQEAEIDYRERHYMLLDVSRDNVLRDACDQMWQRRKSDLLRPLRVRLGEMNELEVGHDLGGVQIEFFNLLCKEAFAEETQMFTTDSSTGLCYVCPGSLQPLYMFELLGSLFALAIFNGITLPVNMPQTFYSILLQSSATPIITSAESFRCDWPCLWKSLQTILKEEVLDLEYSFPFEANGLRMDVTMSEESQGTIQIVGVASVTSAGKHHATPVDVSSLDWPGWRFRVLANEPPTIKTENREQYVADYIHWKAVRSVEPQLRAFRSGFHALVDLHSLSIFTPFELKAFVEGSPKLDINDLRRATRYDGYEPKSRYIQSFWRVVCSWSEGKQMQLLKFVTAVERVPLGGASALTFIIKRTVPGSIDHLPTSSTCFGTLLLPRYGSAEILDEKLGIAIDYGLEGFGTG